MTAGFTYWMKHFCKENDLYKMNEGILRNVKL